MKQGNRLRVTHLTEELPKSPSPPPYLSQTFLAGPHGGVDDLEEQLSRAGVEDEDGSVDGLGGQVALKRLEKTQHDRVRPEK